VNWSGSQNLVNLKSLEYDAKKQAVYRGEPTDLLGSFGWSFQFTSRIGKKKKEVTHDTITLAKQKVPSVGGKNTPNLKTSEYGKNKPEGQKKTD